MIQFVECLHLYVVLGCNKNLEKLPQFEILEQSILGVQIGKSRPLEHTQLANQIQGFRIPDCQEAEEKKK